MLKIGSLFSGYGGLDRAVEAVTGATPAWFVEYDAAPSKILSHHWPDVPNYGDVTKVDWSTMPPVDILTGGYPCQPFSQAGQRKGTTDDRHLWPYVREAIRVLRPRLTILENVAGHRSLGFDRVLGDMAEDGMHVRWASLRASDIGAPHHRERLFIVAWQGATDPGHEPGRWGTTDDSGETSAGPYGIRVQRRDGNDPRSGESGQDATDAEDDGRDELYDSAVRNEACSGWLRDSPGGDRCKTSADTEDDGHADTDRQRRDGRGATPEQESRAHAPTDRHRSGIDFGPYAEAVQRWERLTRPAPAPTEPNTKGNPRLNAAFAEWMMGLPEGHVTQVPGISRADQLKAIGNGVCVPQAIAALRMLLDQTALLEMEGI